MVPNDRDEAIAQTLQRVFAKTARLAGVKHPAVNKIQSMMNQSIEKV
jgi:hypothetical protein